MNADRASIGRRERNKREKRERILDAARDLFAGFGVGAVTTQQVAERADVAVGTLFRYASTKAELLIMADAVRLARVVTAVIHMSTTAAIYQDRSNTEVLADIHDQVAVILGSREHATAHPRTEIR